MANQGKKYEWGEKVFITGTNIPALVVEDEGDEVLVIIKAGNQSLQKRYPKNQLTETTEFLTVGEVSRLIDVPRQEIHQWLNKKIVPSFYILIGKRKIRAIPTKYLEELIKYKKTPLPIKRQKGWQRRRRREQEKWEKLNEESPKLKKAIKLRRGN